MGTIGHGYGSEWHLLRHLGYHRNYFSQEVLKVTGGNTIEWLDFKFSPKIVALKNDREFIGLEFIKDMQVQEKWKSFWAQHGNSQNWDAVGKIHFDNRYEWLLVEAKAHMSEIHSDCGAENLTSKQKILLALEKTSQAFGNESKPIEAWLENYYQHANRLAALHFLMNECVPSVNARLLFIYFYGENRKNIKCPQNKEEWLGIDKFCELSKRVHDLFLPVNPLGAEVRSKSNGG